MDKDFLGNFFDTVLFREGVLNDNKTDYLRDYGISKKTIRLLDL